MTSQEHRDKMAEEYGTSCGTKGTWNYTQDTFAFRAGYDECKRSDPNVMALVETLSKSAFVLGYALERVHRDVNTDQSVRVSAELAKKEINAALAQFKESK